MIKVSYSKPSFTEVTLATAKIKRMKAFAIFKDEIWYIDLAYIDKQGKDNNGIKHILVRQDQLVEPQMQKELLTEDSKEAVRAFLITITRNHRPLIVWVNKGLESAPKFTKLFISEKVQVHSILSATKAGSAKHTIRSLKKYFTVLWNLMDTSTVRKCLLSSQP